MTEQSNGTETSFFNEIQGLKTDVSSMLDLAKLAESAERYEEMCLCMQELVNKKTTTISMEERNMLSVAYKNAVGQRRAAWRIISQYNNTADPAMQLPEPVLKDYVTYVENEMERKCKEIVSLVEAKLLVAINPEVAKVEEIEMQVFYLKMCGDYFRYLAEFKKDEKSKNAAKDNYKKALKLSEKLEPTHPTRLGLALNASVCYYEILDNRQDACTLAKEAFDEAIQKLDALSDSTYKDSTLIMQLLRDNLTLWNADSSNATEEQND